MKLNASTRLLADSRIIAPSDSFRDENKDQLKDRQSESRKTEHTDRGNPSTEAAISEDELLADADPKLWNNANQPMG